MLFVSFKLILALNEPLYAFFYLAVFELQDPLSVFSHCPVVCNDNDRSPFFIETAEYLQDFIRALGI